MNKNIAQYNNDDIEKLRIIFKQFLAKKEKIHIIISRDRKRNHYKFNNEIFNNLS